MRSSLNRASSLAQQGAAILEVSHLCFQARRARRQSPAAFFQAGQIRSPAGVLFGGAHHLCLQTCELLASHLQGPLLLRPDLLAFCERSAVLFNCLLEFHSISRETLQFYPRIRKT